MAKAPKKDINLYTLVAGPKKSTVKKGFLFTVLGIVLVVLLIGSYVGVRIYGNQQEKLVEEWTEKASDETLQEKINAANEVMQEINVLRTASGAYETVRLEIDSSEYYTQIFTEDLIDQLLDCETYTLSQEVKQVAVITEIAYDGTTLSLSVTSDESRYASFFVQNLQQLGIFYTISYDGYTSSEDGYVYTVNATFEPYTPTTESAEEEVAE